MNLKRILINIELDNVFCHKFIVSLTRNFKENFLDQNNLKEIII